MFILLLPVCVFIGFLCVSVSVFPMLFLWFFYKFVLYYFDMFVFVLFYISLFYYCSLDACLFVKKRQKGYLDLEGKGDGRD